MKNRRKGRELALHLLFEWSVQGGDIKKLSKEFWEVTPCKEGIREFAQWIALDTVAHIDEIDGWIKKVSKHWDINRINLVDKNIIRLAIFEFLYADDIPCAVTINEAIEIGKMYGAEESGSFVNGILDKVMSITNCGERKKRAEV